MKTTGASVKNPKSEIPMGRAAFLIYERVFALR